MPRLAPGLTAATSRTGSSTRTTPTGATTGGAAPVASAPQNAPQPRTVGSYQPGALGNAIAASRAPDTSMFDDLMGQHQAQGAQVQRQGAYDAAGMQRRAANQQAQQGGMGLGGSYAGAATGAAIGGAQNMANLQAQHDQRGMDLQQAYLESLNREAETNRDMEMQRQLEQQRGTAALEADYARNNYNPSGGYP